MSELSFYVSNFQNVLLFEEESKRNEKGKGQSNLYLNVHPDNYKMLKDLELVAEVDMRKQFILEQVIPLIQTDVENFREEHSLVKGILMFGALQVERKASTEYLKSLKIKELEKIAGKYQNERFATLIMGLLEKSSPSK